MMNNRRTQNRNPRKKTKSTRNDLVAPEQDGPEETTLMHHGNSRHWRRSRRHYQYYFFVPVCAALLLLYPYYQPQPLARPQEVTASQQQRRQRQETSNKTNVLPQPIDCPSFLSSSIKDTHLTRKIHASSWSKRNYSFSMSFHDQAYDPTRYRMYVSGDYVETAMTKLWLDLLEKTKETELRIIDIGANIGYFSLLSASLSSVTKKQVKVDAFEPNQKNILRFCESIHLNQWRKSSDTNNPVITIHPYGVSNTNAIQTFYSHPTNPGGRGSFVSNKHMNDKMKIPQSQIPLRTLDTIAWSQGNWFSSSSSPAKPIFILKIDTECCESSVILGARELLQRQLVQHVFTETSLYDPSRMDVERNALHLLQNAGYSLRGFGGRLGPSPSSVFPNDEHLVDNIFRHIQKQKRQGKEDFVNLWWSL